MFIKFNYHKIFVTPSSAVYDHIQDKTTPKNLKEINFGSSCKSTYKHIFYDTDSTLITKIK